MPIHNRLLKRSYALAEKRKFEDIPILLDAVVQDNPNNIEAWEFYLNIFSRDRKKLEELGERIRSSELIHPQVKDEILIYFEYLLNRSINRETALKMRRQNLSTIGIGICIIFAFTTPFWVPREIMEIVLRFAGILFIAVAGYFGVNWLLKNWFHKRNDAWNPSQGTILRSYALDTQLSLIDPEMTPAPEDKECAPEKEPTPERKRRPRKTRKAGDSLRKETHHEIANSEHSKRSHKETTKTRSPRNSKPN